MHGAEAPADPKSTHIESTAQFLNKILPLEPLQKILLQYDCLRYLATINTDDEQIIRIRFNSKNRLCSMNHNGTLSYKIPSGEFHSLNWDAPNRHIKSLTYQEPYEMYVDISLINSHAISRDRRYIAFISHNKNNIVPFPGDASRKAYILKGDNHRTNIALFEKTNYTEQLARALGIKLARKD